MSNTHPANPPPDYSSNWNRYQQSDQNIEKINTRANVDRADAHLGPNGQPIVTVGIFDPVKVNVEFSWNDQKQLCIDGPNEPGYSHLQKLPRRLATERDKILFAPQYQLFLSNQDQFKTGTLLDVLIRDKETVKAWYKAGIYNIESVANVSEAVMSAHPKLDEEVRKKAQRWVNHQLYEKDLQAKDAEIARLMDEITQLKQQLEPQSRTRAKL